MEKRQSLNRSSIISLQSSSLLSQENQEAVNELAEQLQAEGFKVMTILYQESIILIHGYCIKS